MKRKITERYMSVFTISVILIILIWLISIYLTVFSGNEADQNEPQYLINRFEEYVEEEDDIWVINDRGKQLLDENNLWAQIIDDEGVVVSDYNTPQVAPAKYNIFEISNYTMNSDAMDSQTIFIKQFSNREDLGIIIGCDSGKVSKVSIKLRGSFLKIFILCSGYLIVIFLLVGIGSGLIFSKNIAAPVNDIIENINKLESEEKYEYNHKKGKLFKGVFDSLEKLRRRLVSADIERKNAEQQRKEWIDNISHDMKTPLSSIKGYAEIMSDEGYKITDDERMTYSNKIVNNAETIKDLIDELKLSRLLENGEIQLQKEEINICRLLEECCSDILGGCKTKNIVLNFGKKVIYAVIDKQLMSRCFTNIIVNAIIHNNENVNIEINCYQKEKVIIEIIDDGKGMTEEEKDKVFSRYYRGKSSDKVVGSGLGLAISKEIIDAHNGKIYVESEKDKGCKFTIEL